MICKQAHRNSIWDFTKFGKTVFTGSCDGLVRAWQLSKKGELRLIKSIPNMCSMVYCVKLLDGKLYASGRDIHNVCLSLLSPSFFHSFHFILFSFHFFSFLFSLLFFFSPFSFFFSLFTSFLSSWYSLFSYEQFQVIVTHDAMLEWELRRVVWIGWKYPPSPLSLLPQRVILKILRIADRMQLLSVSIEKVL